MCGLWVSLILENMLTSHLLVPSYFAEYHFKAVFVSHRSNAMFIHISISNVLHSVTSHTVQSVHLAAGPVIKSFTASSHDWMLSGWVSAGRLHSWHWIRGQSQCQGLEPQGQGQGHAILSSRHLEAKDMALRTPTLYITVNMWVQYAQFYHENHLG